MFHAIRVSRVENSVEYVNNSENPQEYKADYLLYPNKGLIQGCSEPSVVEKDVENVEITG